MRMHSPPGWPDVCAKWWSLNIAPKVAHAIFCQVRNNFGYLFNFKKSPKCRKLAQSGHPPLRRKYNDRIVDECFEKKHVAQPLSGVGFSAISIFKKSQNVKLILSGACRKKAYADDKDICNRIKRGGKGCVSSKQCCSNTSAHRNNVSDS
jgi:hypothetical protein